ncbi:MAG: EVE domain-containing protein [Chthoniobacterales bacterium]
MKRFWMVKQEPTAYAWEQFVQDGRTNWTGVRNYQARNNLRAMQKGDEVFYYHSVTGKEVVGVAVVSKPAFPDPTATEGDWSCVELQPKKALSRPVSLAEIKADAALQNILLVRNGRISVLPLEKAEFERILELSKN